MEIRSYRAVFDLERRIYRVDRLRLNPGGIPLRGVVYCLALLAGLALLGALPLVGAAVRALPWYLRDLVLPAGGAALLTVIRVEGRPFHLAAAALLRHALGPRAARRLVRARRFWPALRATALDRRSVSAPLQRVWYPGACSFSPTARTRAFAACATPARARCSCGWPTCVSDAPVSSVAWAAL